MISGKKGLKTSNGIHTELSYFCFLLEPAHQKFKLGFSSFPLISLGNQNEIHYEQEINKSEYKK